MEDKLLKIFKQAKYEPDKNMVLSVWNTIIIQEKRATRFKLWSLSFIGFASLAGMVPTFEKLLSNLAHSGFYEYFSLIFSDGGAMLSSWKELSLSLAQSLPIMNIIYTLTLIFIFFLSLRYVMRQIDKNQLMDFTTLSV